MQEKEKLKAITTLANIIFQHMGLKVMPNFFICSEDNGYGCEGYLISWEDTKYMAEISFSKPDGETTYKYWLFIVGPNETNPAAYCMDEYIDQNKLSDKHPKLIEFIDFVNGYFCEKAATN